MVTNKLRSGALPVTGSLHPRLLDDVVSTLFPLRDGGGGHPPAGQAHQDLGWSADIGVTEGELLRAVRRLGAKNTALGPDGIPGRAWVIALSVLGDRLRQLFDCCLRTGRFSPIWKEAGLVLIPKSGRSADSPSAYRRFAYLTRRASSLKELLLPVSSDI